MTAEQIRHLLEAVDDLRAQLTHATATLAKIVALLGETSPPEPQYTGPITVGDHFIWMIEKTAVRCHVEVTRIDKVDSQGGPFDERRIWTRVIAGNDTNKTGLVTWNDEGRCREAFTPCDARGVAHGIERIG